MWWLRLTRANSAIIPTVQMVATGCLIGGMISGLYTFWEWMIPLGVYFCTGCLGITMTFHRYLAHNSFDFRWRWEEYLFSLFGSLGLTGSPLGWVMFHLNHHKYADTPLDPHSPLHQGGAVLFGSYTTTFDKWMVRKLIRSRFHRVLHDYYHVILLGWGILLTTFSYLVWDDPRALFLGLVFPAAIQIWISNLSNYFNHKRNFGYINFKTKDDSRNILWLNLITFGEGGGHNLHHRYPWCAKYSIRKHEYDITFWMIKLFGRNPHLLGGMHEAKLL